MTVLPPPRAPTPPTRSLAPGPVARVQGLALLAVVLLVWQLRGDPASPFFPAPSAWWSALLELHAAGRVVPALATTLGAFLAGLVTGTVVGAVVGALLGRVRGVDRAAGPTLEFLRALPPAAIVPLATLLLGFGAAMKVTVVGLAATWAVLLQARAAAGSLDATLEDVGRTLRLSRWRWLAAVLAPSLAPAVLRGLRLSTSTALVVTLVAEYLTGARGIGGLAAEAQRTFQPARVYAMLVLAAATSVLANALVTAAQARVATGRTRD